MYSIASGEVIHDLSGHTGIVTGITLHSENHLQALSCGLDKSIIRWDYTDGVLLQVPTHELLIIYMLYTVQREDPKTLIHISFHADFSFHFDCITS